MVETMLSDFTDYRFFLKKKPQKHEKNMLANFTTYSFFLKKKPTMHEKPTRHETNKSSVSPLYLV